MPQDLLQIALEHHRSGRLRQAESTYRSILSKDPGNPEAMHWLGVLLYQAGQLDEAILLLEQAAAIRPADAAFQHNLAQAYLSSNRAAEATTVFEKSAALDATRGETQLGLGLARMAVNEPDAALFAFRHARAIGLDTAELHHHLGVALLATGQAEEALAACRTALEKDPDDAVACYHMALAHRLKNEPRDVRKCLTRALEMDPKLARAWATLAALEAEEGKLQQAAALFRKAIAVKPDYAAAHQGLGRVLEQSGKKEQAVQAFRLAVRASRGEIRKGPEPSRPTTVAELERKITPDKATMELHYAVATLTKIAPPALVPPAAVAGLFDKYAENFDQHLQVQLEYRAPELLVDAIAATRPPKQLDILDLGCGTGLCGALLRPIAANLCGVDLSPAMIEKCKARGVYDRLELSELVQALRQTPRSFDLLVAADVLIYLGDLMPTFEAAASALRPGGMLAFTVEAGTGDRYELEQKTRRYLHSKPYLQRLASMFGFEEEHFAEVVLRMNAGQPVNGFLVLLRLPLEE